MAYNKLLISLTVNEYFLGGKINFTQTQNIIPNHFQFLINGQQIIMFLVF